MMNIKAMLKHGFIKKPRRPRKPRPVKVSRSAEVAYRDALLRIVDQLHKATEQYVLPVLKRTESQYARPAKDSLTMDGYAADIMASIEQMGRSLGGIDAMAQRLAHAAVQKQAIETEVQLAQSLTNTLGVDMRATVAAVDATAEIEAATLANVALINSIPTQYIEKLKGQVMSGITTGRRYEDLADDIEHLLDTTESRAKVIARDQMAKVNGAVNEAKQTGLGIESYTWSTSGDERVRESHAAHEGQVFRWDEPPADTGHPGDDVMCRCTAIPNIDFEDDDT